ncbi:MAG: hypothetical protein ACPG46_04385 [Thalassotalea sp.]
MMLSLTTIALILSTPAVTMLAASIVVSLFERTTYSAMHDCIGNLNV